MSTDVTGATAATASPQPQVATDHRSSSDEPFLVVEDLSVQFPTADGLVQAVSELSYTVELGKTLGIVGESGSGKSVSSMAVMGLHDRKRTRMTGSIRLGGTELLTLDEERMRKVRGNQAAMIFQDPLTSLHPFYSIGDQITEGFAAHHPDASKADSRARAVEMLDRVGIPQAKRRVDDYPHQFSGGMRQRVMIAMSLVNDPQLLIADEPTTALDVTVQAQILDLLQELQRDFGSAIIIITHDLGVVAETADDVMVMYGGRAVEYGTAKEVLTRPEMPYTWGLLSSIPDLGGDTTKRLKPIPGAPPSLLAPPDGCLFHPRCRHSNEVPGDLCFTVRPELEPGRPGSTHLKRCHLPDPDAVFAAEYVGGQYVGKTDAPVEHEGG